MKYPVSLLLARAIDAVFRVLCRLMHEGYTDYLDGRSAGSAATLLHYLRSRACIAVSRQVLSLLAILPLGFAERAFFLLVDLKRWWKASNE